jgi:hypothetical protein
MPPKKNRPVASRSETPEQIHNSEVGDPVPQQHDNDPHNDDNDEEPDNKQNLEDESTATLAEAIMLMTQELRRREAPARKTKAKEPDTFDGSDPKKLNNFILLCNLFFRNSPAYDDDKHKVTFALSYLRGTALEYFEPSILDSDEIPDWMDNWSAFIRTLRIQFGPIDPTADAEDGIDNLKMHDNQHIVKYNVEFNRLAIRTGWDDGVLRHRYYSGLAERIKDIMGQQGKPVTLEDMKHLAHSIDSRHWERLREKSRAGRNKSDHSDKTDSKNNKSDDKGKSSTSGNNNNNQSKNNNNNKSNNKPAKSASTSGNSASIADKLGKDGKLAQDERQRRFDNNLCLYCGGTGHTAKNCPKSTSSASKAKARAAQARTSTQANDKEKDTPDPKKV